MSDVERWGKEGALEATSAAARNVGRKSYRRYAILRTRSREASEANSRLHYRNSQSHTPIPLQDAFQILDASIPTNLKLMESSLHQVWESAVGDPFVPTVGKGSQFLLGFTLLTVGLLLSGLFGLSTFFLTILI